MEMIYLKNLAEKLVLPFSLVLLMLFSISAHSQMAEDKILGKWMKTPGDDLVIEVYKINNEYQGKITWANNDASKPIGFIILEQLKYSDKSKSWVNGKIHSPSGSTYSATARLKEDGSLEVHGYKGMKLLGKKRYFKRVP
jgi:uncharacterized protein (DUF2147 family)